MKKLRKPPLLEEATDTAKPSGNGSLVPRDAKGRVVEGAVLNPLGRAPGSKDKISQAFLRDFFEVWERLGHQAIEKVAKKDPRSFVYAALALVPREHVVDEVQRIYIIRDTPLTAEEWQEKHAGGAPIKDIN
jgi:hypothetical protein